MITKLTQSQLDHIPAHNKKWIDLGLHPKQFTEAEAVEIVGGLYDHILKKTEGSGGNMPISVLCLGWSVLL